MQATLFIWRQKKLIHSDIEREKECLSLRKKNIVFIDRVGFWFCSREIHKTWSKSRRENIWAGSSLRTLSQVNIAVEIVSINGVFAIKSLFAKKKTWTFFLSRRTRTCPYLSITLYNQPRMIYKAGAAQFKHNPFHTTNYVKILLDFWARTTINCYAPIKRHYTKIHTISSKCISGERLLFRINIKCDRWEDHSLSGWSVWFIRNANGQMRKRLSSVLLMCQ